MPKPYVKLCTLICFLLLAGCAPSAGAVQTAIAQTQSGATEKQVAVQSDTVVAPTTTPRPTSTSQPTAKPKPTKTPKPKNTAVPTAAPDPDPVTLTGQGDQIVDFKNPFDYAIVHIMHKGASNFIVRNYDADGNRIDGLVNEIGNYDGVLPLDFSAGERTSRFEVKADGQWKIEISALWNAHNFKLPGQFEGEGDDVVWFTSPESKSADVATIKHSGTSNFIVRGFSDGGGQYGLVNEIGNYEGQLILEPMTFIFIIKADGAWSVDVTTR